jgi:hypothetical protein
MSVSVVVVGSWLSVVGVGVGVGVVGCRVSVIWGYRLSLTCVAGAQVTGHINNFSDHQLNA